MTEREFALDVVRRLQQAGFAALWAGGCVRDELPGLVPAGFDLATDPATLAAARRMAGEIRVVSPERIAEELRKTLAHPNRGRGVRLLGEFGLVEPILPELAARGPAAWSHAARVVECLPREASFPLAFAALLHEIGKSAAEAVADRLRLSTVEKTRVAW